METAVRESLSEAEIEQLADRLEASTDLEALTLEGVDGLFCALIASPRTVLPNEYLPAIFGPEEIAFTGLDDANATIGLLMRYWNSIIADLEHESIHLPFVFEDPDGGLVGREWAQGFLAGTRLARDGWKELFDSDREGDLFMIPLLAGEVDRTWPKEPITPEFEEQVLHSMSVGFLRIYRHFADARRRATMTSYDRAASMPEAHSNPYVRTGYKVGRNDPCPCGSGNEVQEMLCGSERRTLALRP